MLFSQDRKQLRQMYIDAWRKSQSGDVLSALEEQIVAVVSMHPEYHNDLQPEAVDVDYRPEGGKTNPFLHMGLHLAIREQIATNRPAGIRQAYQALLSRTADEHTAQHQMIDVLAETLWDAQSNNRPPDEGQYLQKLTLL